MNTSDLGRALAALRPRATFTCEVCRQSFEAWARKPDRQPPRTCSPACRQQLYRNTKRSRMGQLEGHPSD